MDKRNPYRKQIISDQRFFPLDLHVMSSSFWQNLPILGVIIFNRLCGKGGKKGKIFHSFLKKWVLQSFAGFWWDLVVWLKMGRDRQQVSDPDIKPWDVEGWGGAQGGPHTETLAVTHTLRHHVCIPTHTLYSHKHKHLSRLTHTHTLRNSSRGSNGGRQRTVSIQTSARNSLSGPNAAVISITRTSLLKTLKQQTYTLLYIVFILHLHCSCHFFIPAYVRL